VIHGLKERFALLARLARESWPMTTGFALAGAMGCALIFSVVRPPERNGWPVEGYYFPAVQYQLTLQSLRLALAGVWTASSDSERADMARTAELLAQVLHAKAQNLIALPDLVPYYSKIDSFDRAALAIHKFDGELDGLVASAEQSKAGLADFDRQSEDAHARVVTLANDFRMAELVAYQRDFDAFAAAALSSRRLSQVLYCVFVLVLAFTYSSFRRNKRALLKEIEAHADAQRSAQARTALLGMVSHELRTPLQTIVAASELLVETIPEHAPGGLAARRIDKGASTLATQLDNLAQYAKVASGAAEPRSEWIGLASTINVAIEEHLDLARDNKQTIAFRSELNTNEDRVQSDPVTIRQIVNNYLSNAVKYSGPGEIVVTLRRNFGVRSSSIEVAVSDRGPGVAPSDRQRIWEPYFRGAGRGQRRGSGLGLAVVKLLASARGWSAGLRETVGGGATFFLVIPEGRQ